MANQYGLFWNSQNSDRLYDADSFEEWLKKFFTTGVFNGDLQVTASSGMTVAVGTGYANVNGKVRFFDSASTFTLSPASGTYSRIDTIVVERNDTNREITLKYVQGEYSGTTPAPTAPIRTGGVYQIVLAQIYVGVGVTEINTGNITDTRANANLCGWVTGTVDSVDVDQLTAQAQAQFETWFEEMKGQLSEDAAGNLQNQIDALKNPTIVDYTLVTADWTNGTYTISNSLITENSEQEFLPSVSITENQLSALQSANIQDGGQSAGVLTLKAFGTVPTISIPIRIIYRG